MNGIERENSNAGAVLSAPHSADFESVTQINGNASEAVARSLGHLAQLEILRSGEPLPDYANHVFAIAESIQHDCAAQIARLNAAASTAIEPAAGTVSKADNTRSGKRRGMPSPDTDINSRLLSHDKSGAALQDGGVFDDTSELSPIQEYERQSADIDFLLAHAFIRADDPEMVRALLPAVTTIEQKVALFEAAAMHRNEASAEVMAAYDMGSILEAELQDDPKHSQGSRLMADLLCLKLLGGIDRYTNLVKLRQLAEAGIGASDGQLRRAAFGLVTSGYGEQALQLISMKWGRTTDWNDFYSGTAIALYFIEGESCPSAVAMCRKLQDTLQDKAEKTGRRSTRKHGVRRFFEMAGIQKNEQGTYHIAYKGNATDDVMFADSIREKFEKPVNKALELLQIHATYMCGAYTEAIAEGHQLIYSSIHSQGELVPVAKDTTSISADYAAGLHTLTTIDSTDRGIPPDAMLVMKKRLFIAAAELVARRAEMNRTHQEIIARITAKLDVMRAERPDSDEHYKLIDHYTRINDQHKVSTAMENIIKQARQIKVTVERYEVIQNILDFVQSAPQNLSQFLPTLNGLLQECENGMNHPLVRSIYGLPERPQDS